MSFKLLAAAWTGSLMLSIVFAGCGGKSLQPSGAAGAGGGGGHAGTGGTPHNETSPGTVTLRFTAPPSAYCDATCGSPLQHITIYTLGKEPVTTAFPFCSTMCSNNCQPVGCPAGGACLLTGLAVTSAELQWDGRAYEMSTCNEGHVACQQLTFVPAGTYIARMCATPGMVSTSPDGTPVCTASGSLECVDVSFDLPGKSLVTGSLDGAKACHAMSTSAYDQTCATDADCVNVPEGDYCQGTSCTNCANATVSARAQMQYEADRAMNTLKTVTCPCSADVPPICDHGKCARSAVRRSPSP